MNNIHVDSIIDKDAPAKRELRTEADLHTGGALMDILAEDRARDFVLLTNADETRNVARRWKAQYYEHGSDWGFVAGDKASKDIYDELVGLGDDPAVEDINRVIGNESWTSLECSMCSSRCDQVVHLRSDECPHWLCRDCLSFALGLFPALPLDTHQEGR